MKSLLFATATIKSKENLLLNNEKFTRILESESLSDGVKILLEGGYGGGINLDNPFNYEKLLDNELISTIDFIRDIIPLNYGLESFFIKLDYHNAKSLYKAKHLKINDAAFMLAPYGMISAELINECIHKSDYSNLYAPMRDAFKDMDNKFLNAKVNPRYIDTTLDRAYYKDALIRLSSAKGDTTALKKYFIASIDTMNILTFLRLRKLNSPLSDLKESFILGGKINLESLEKIYEQNIELLIDTLRYTDYSVLSTSGVEEFNEYAYVNYEIKRDNYLMNIIKAERNNMFSIAPVVGYYLAKLNEIRVIRVILSGIKNGVDRELIKKRMRESYAQ